MSNMFLKPARNADGKPNLVRDPITFRPLAENGEWKAPHQFWSRRLYQNEVIDDTENEQVRVIAAAQAKVIPATPVAPVAHKAADRDIRKS